LAGSGLSTVEHSSWARPRAYGWPVLAYPQRPHRQPNKTKFGLLGSYGWIWQATIVRLLLCWPTLIMMISTALPIRTPPTLLTSHHDAVQPNPSTTPATPNPLQHVSLVQAHSQQGHHPSATSHRGAPLSSAGPNDNDPYLVRLPALLTVVRCYTDASTSLDLPSNLPRNAGIGIFIINNQVHPVQTIYIKSDYEGNHFRTDGRSSRACSRGNYH
jgi:hypothetical protein